MKTISPTRITAIEECPKRAVEEVRDPAGSGPMRVGSACHWLLEQAIPAPDPLAVVRTLEKTGRLAPVTGLQAIEMAEAVAITTSYLMGVAAAGRKLPDPASILVLEGTGRVVSSEFQTKYTVGEGKRLIGIPITDELVLHGAMDIAVQVDAETAAVIDYKSGKQKYPQSEKFQISCYAWFMFKMQPWVNRVLGKCVFLRKPLEVEPCVPYTRAELPALEADIRLRAVEADLARLAPVPEARPGRHCRWCAVTCGSRKE